MDQTIVQFFVDRGYPQAVARGIAAGIQAESASNPSAKNKSSGAFGLGQWLGARKKELVRRYGANPTKRQQLEFLDWELKGGDHGGPAVRKQRTEAGALNAYIRQFMRPAAGSETAGDIRRGRAALGLAADGPRARWHAAQRRALAVRMA